MITTPRTSWSKRAAVLLTAAALALPVTAAAVPAAAAPVAPAVVAAPAAPAEAVAAACPGRRVVHKPIKLRGHIIGWLNVYSTGSTKCAVTMHAGSTWGRWAWTRAEIWSSNSSSVVAGDYRYRTGRASVGGVSGVCVSAQGAIDWRGSTRTATVHGLCG